MSLTNNSNFVTIRWEIENCNMISHGSKLYLETSVFETETDNEVTLWKLKMENADPNDLIYLKLHKVKGNPKNVKYQMSYASDFSNSALLFLDDSLTIPFSENTKTVYIRIWYEMIKPKEYLFCTALHETDFYLSSLNGSDIANKVYDKNNIQLMLTKSDNKNNTRHSYGFSFPQQTVAPRFLYTVFVEILSNTDKHLFLAQGQLSLPRSNMRVVFQIENSKRNTIVWNIEDIANTGFTIASVLNQTPNIQFTMLVGIESSPEKFPVPVPSNPMRNHLQAMFREKLFSDATLNTRGQSFSVHKSILAARSAVFRAMFVADHTTEGRSGVVDIDDLDGGTVDRMLVFLYGDSVQEDLEWEDVGTLYYAADKYAVQDLKQRCVGMLKRGMSVSNACDALLLADKHADQELTKHAVDFIGKHDEIVSSEKYEEFADNHPRLAAKVIRDIYLSKMKK